MTITIESTKDAITVNGKPYESIEQALDAVETMLSNPVSPDDEGSDDIEAGEGEMEEAAMMDGFAMKAPYRS